jgi:hypothetical protein
VPLKEIILPGSNVVLNAIGQCWSDQIFLYGLSHRFWKLTLQLITRYSVWTKEVTSESFVPNKVYIIQTSYWNHQETDYLI